MSLQTTFATESRKINFVATDKPDVTAKKEISGNQDVFSQVFSDMQRMDKAFGASDIKKDDVRASDIEKPKAERKDCAEKPARKDECRRAERSDDDDQTVSDVREDDDRAANPQRTEECQGKAADNDDKGEKSPEPETPGAARPEEPVAKKAVGIPEGAETKVEAETVEFSDIIASQGGTEPTAEQKTQTQIPAVIVAPTQDAKTATPQKTEAETQDPQQNAAHEEAAQLKTISFRADPAANDDKAGKGNAVAESESTQQVVADVAPAVEDIKIKGKDAPLPAHIKAAAHQDAKVAETGTATPSASEGSDDARQLNALIRDAAIEKRDLRLAAALESDVTQDQPVSHPAAGTRVIAPVGFSAPPSSNGSSGGGSLPLQQAVKGDAAAAQPIAVDGVRAASSHETPSIATLARARESMPGSNMQPSEQVAVQLHRMAKSGTDRFDMQLHPAELGRVDIRMEISKDGVVQVTVTADNQAAYDMLQKDQRGLERALQQAGLQTDSGSLSFNLRGGEANSQQQREAQNSRGGNGSGGNDRQAQAANDDSITTTNYSVAPGRVDVRV